MTQEQLMKVKIKYLEDRITTLEKSIGSINKILGRFQMTEDDDSGFKDIGELSQGFCLKSKDNDNELI
jgi:hypothetical protein